MKKKNIVETWNIVTLLFFISSSLQRRFDCIDDDVFDVVYIVCLALLGVSGLAVRHFCKLKYYSSIFIFSVVLIITFFAYLYLLHT